MDENHSSGKAPVMVIVVNVLVTLVFLAILGISFFNKPWTTFAFNNFSYYIILVLFITWLGVLIHVCKDKYETLAGFFLLYWKGILFALCLTAVIFVSVPKHYRVLSDETSLLSVARSMTFKQQVNNVTESRYYYYANWDTHFAAEKRPFLFPFFTSLTHNFLGYRPENVFILNFLVLWAVLSALYMIIRRPLGDTAAFTGLLLAAAQPIVALSAASGSYEIFNLLFVLLSFLALRSFLDDPRHQALLFLVFNLAMLANIRYESSLFFIVVMGILLMTGCFRFKDWGRSFLYGLVPFFFLSLIWQRIVMLGVSDPNLPGGSWLKAFSLGNIQRNMLIFFKESVHWGGSNGYAGLINVLGLGALVYFAAILLMKYKEPDRKSVVLFAASVFSVLAIFILVLSYQIDPHPMNGRVHLPVLIVLSVLPVYFLAKVLKDKQHLGLLMAAAFFIFYHPVAVEDRLSNTLMIVRDFRRELEFFKQAGDKNFLIVCGRPGQFIVYNYGAISFSTANKEKNNILQQLKNHLYSRVFIVQEILYAKKAPAPFNDVAKEYVLRTVQEFQGNQTYFVRISEVVNNPRP